MKFIAKEFYELTLDELYEILKSRAEIFLLEQNIICQDLDDKDKEALHCFFYENNRVIAYLRAFKSDEDEVTIGRVLTLDHKKGFGTLLMNESIAEIKKHFRNNKLCVHAQKQAFQFYEKNGFSIVSDEYIEEGIIHITMEKYI